MLLGGIHLITTTIVMSAVLPGYHKALRLLQQESATRLPAPGAIAPMAVSSATMIALSITMILAARPVLRGHGPRTEPSTEHTSS